MKTMNATVMLSAAAVVSVLFLTIPGMNAQRSCDGLAFLLPFDAPNPTLDASGNGFNLVAGESGSPAPAAGTDCKIGECRSFDNNHYDLSQSLGAVPAAGMTFSLWFHPDGAQKKYARLFQFDEWDVGLGITDGDYLFAVVWTGSHTVRRITKVAQINLNEWNHVAWALEKSSPPQWHFWVNGELHTKLFDDHDLIVECTGACVRDNDKGKPLNYPDSAGSTNKNWVGDLPRQDTDRPFAGRIDDMRFFLGVLPDADAKALYNTPSGCCTRPGEVAEQNEGTWSCVSQTSNRCNGVTFRFSFDAPNPTLDASGNGFNLVADESGSSLAPAVGTDCKIGECRSFDNNHYDLSQSLGAVPAAGMTFSLWFHPDGAQEQYARLFQFDEWDVGLGITDGDYLFAVVWTGSHTVRRITKVAQINLNEWNHVAWALGKSSPPQWHFWVNGELHTRWSDNHRSIVECTGGCLRNDNGEPLNYPDSAANAAPAANRNWVGDHPRQDTERPFEGKIDELTLFARVLSHADAMALYNTIPCECGTGLYGDPSVLCESCSAVSCPAGLFQNQTACGGEADGCQDCVSPAVGEYCEMGSTADVNVECPAGYFCAGGNAAPQNCTAAEGFYCPAGFVSTGSSSRRSGGSPLEGVQCPLGHYCAGLTADAEPCTAAVGFYCPAGFAPTAPSVQVGLAGKSCPPHQFCSGQTAGPEPRPSVCDLVQACGGVDANETCAAAQSTFYKYQDPPVEFAVDKDGSTCMKTADAIKDPLPQWLSVDLGSSRLIGTVRFSSDGAASDFEVRVSGEAPAEAAAANPSAGAATPTSFETCPVQATASSGVFEAVCAAAVKGQFVFIHRTRPRHILEVCDVEVFGHACQAQAEVWCPIGTQPSGCTSSDAFCPGCVPCPAGTYSDKVGPYACTMCPGHALYDEVPYSPEGSTSVFQCEGDAHLDGTSTLDVETVAFNTTTDAWEIEIAFEVAPRIQINGIATIFLSKGGDASPANDDTFQAKNFPCRADASRAAGSDHSAYLAESVCCLQDMRQDYLMTKIFRDFTDGLDLVAANDKCDGADGSTMLVNADLAVVGAGTTFVDTDGNGYTNSITVKPLPSPETRRSHETYTGVQRARITIPDAELYKVSKSLNPDGNLTDSRELFVGLLDLLPTGTRVVDSASQQISIVLTRTQYGTFAAFGEQNIDNDFISFLNGRAHKVVSQFPTPDPCDDAVAVAGCEGERRSEYGPAYYAEITYVYDDRLAPVDEAAPVVVGSVDVTYAEDGTDVNVCRSEYRDQDFVDVATQECGPADLDWGAVCPQVSIPDDNFGRIYIPIYPEGDNSIHIEFDLWLRDAAGRNTTLSVSMDLVASDFVSWCAAASGSVNLAERVIPRIIVGTEADSPPRLSGWGDMDDGDAFSTGAETLQDGLVTLILDLNETNALDDNLEVFFEDVLVIHVNPGSQPDVNAIKRAVSGENSKYMPTPAYNPDSRDAWLKIPDDLKTDCPAEDATTSFFGCVHKHILRNKVITNVTDAYFVGSSPPPAAGAQDFVETMLGDGTAVVAARELGRDFENYLMTEEGLTKDSRKSIGLWINPGHKWGGVTANSEFSLSNHLIIHVLFGVRSGVDGSERRMLLSTNGDGTNSLVRTLQYNVNAATLVESVMDDVVAIEVEARLALAAEEACMLLASLREMCSERLRAAVAPHASKVERVECVSVQVENAGCGDIRRADSAPVAVVDAVIALAQSESAFLDIDAVVASGSVLGMMQTGGKTFPSAEGQTLTPAGELEGQVEDGDKASDSGSGSGSGSNTVIIGAAAGAAAGVVLVAFGAWKVSKQCSAPTEPLTEVVSTGVVEPQAQPVSEKARIENLLFDNQQQ